MRMQDVTALLYRGETIDVRQVRSNQTTSTSDTREASSQQRPERQVSLG